MISLEEAATHEARAKTEWFPKPRNSYDRNRRQFINELALSFIDHFGVSNCGVLTLTFPHFVSWNQAQHCLHKAFRRLLPSLFKGYITIVDFGESNGVHFHILVATHSDIRTGFNNDVYLQIDKIRKAAKTEHRRLNRSEIKLLKSLTDQLTNNDELKELQARLTEKLPQFGFGRTEFIPIRETPQAVATYLSNSLIESINRRPSNLKRPKMWRESKNFPRELCSAQFRNLTEGGRAWRQKAALVAGLLGQKTSDGMRSMFGRGYGYKMMQAIQFVNIVIPDLWKEGPSIKLRQTVWRFF